MGYEKFALSIVDRYVDLLLPSFKSIKQDLDGSGLHYNLREYTAVAILTPVLVFVASLLSFSLVLGALLDSSALAFFLSLLITTIFTAATFGVIFAYPGMVAKDRKKKIETVMPFATTYMATIAGSGAPPVTVFRLMSEFSEYGEFSREIQRIIRDVDVFGHDLPTALKRMALKTPSDQMRELMWGILSTSLSGANLAVYLRGKSENFLNEYRRRLQDYAKQLSLFVEIYLTLIIVGSIFFMVISTIMSAISPTGSVVVLQFMIVFAFLPVISVGFVYLLKGASPLAK